MTEEKQNYHRRLFIWAILIVAGAAGWLFLLFAGNDPARAWRALLINFLYFAPISAAMVTWSAITVCSNGRWPGESERLSWSGFAFLVPSIVLLVLLWIGSPTWTPWYGKELRQGLWLNNTFVFSRDIAAIVLFWLCALWYMQNRRQGRRGAWISGGTLIVTFCVMFSLLGFDLAMSLNPHWHSMAFGPYFFISSLYGGILSWTLLVVLHGKNYGPELRHDFGRLVFAFAILTTYFFFIQLLPIWYENLLDETLYLVHRMNYVNWKLVSSLVVGIVYLGPLVMLLTIKAKRSRFILGAITILLLLGLWFERWWMVTPTFSRTVILGLPELCAFAGTLGLMGLGVVLAQKYVYTLEIREDPEIEETTD